MRVLFLLLFVASGVAVRAQPKHTLLINQPDTAHVSFTNLHTTDSAHVQLNTDPAFTPDYLVKNALRRAIESIFFLMAAECSLKTENWEIHQE